MSASVSKKKSVPSMARPGELHTLLITDILLPLPSTPQPVFTKKVQMSNGEDSNPNNDNVAVVTTFIQTIKTLKIHKLNFYYSNQDKLKECL